MIIEKNKAFLLIEVLVTILVISVSLIFINRAFTSSLTAAGISREFLYAMMALEEKLFDFELSPPRDDSESSGDIDFLGREFRWSQKTLPIEDEDDFEFTEEDIALKRFKVTLTWQRHNIERSIDILTYIPTAEEKEE